MGGRSLVHRYSRFASVTHYVGFAIIALADPGLRGLALGYALSPTTWAETPKWQLVLSALAKI